MPSNTTSRWRAALNTQLLTDITRGTILAGIEKVASNSTLMSIPAIAASYAALVQKGEALTANVTAAGAAKAAFVVASDLRDSSRSAFDLELVAFKSLVESNATSPDDITGMGLTLSSPHKAGSGPPDPPVGALIVRIGSMHGKARVSVPKAGNGSRFVAEVATDPAGPWTSLPGTGRQRKLSGPSGTKLWVRFATVRYGMQSDWCTPVLVTLP